MRMSCPQFNIPTQVAEQRRAKAGQSQKTILQNSHGCVKPGEMLLVLGRPGAGCTTLLNIPGQQAFGYAEVTGEVYWGSLDHKTSSGVSRADCHEHRGRNLLSTLTVGQTMDIATGTKVPARRPDDLQNPDEYQKAMKEFLLRSMSIEHTHDTKVGNEFVRGVSGGERKRVSIIETMATRGSVYCWDNSTRGLDASNALEWTRALRAMTDIMGLSTIATLYQAGNNIYNLFDKVLVLDEGREIFFGKREDARPYMEELGFFCDDSANVADFLTGVTVPTERAIKPGFEHSFPRNADAIRASYEKSDIKRAMEATYDYPSSEEAKSNTDEFKLAITEDKHKSLPKHSPLTTSFTVQLRNCIVRQYQIIWGDKATFFLKQIAGVIQALVTGSLFYMAPNSTPGLFIKSGSLFFALFYNSLVALSETTESFTGRPILAKHKSFAFYHPAAFCIGQITADLPIIFLQISLFGIVLYFMVGLQTTAAAFFTFWFILYSAAICMTAFFRLIGAAFGTFDAASKVSGLMIISLVTYIGYEIRKPEMHPWFVWIYWINPLSYAFSALLSNELHGQTFPCVLNNIVPAGPGVRRYSLCCMHRCTRCSSRCHFCYRRPVPSRFVIFALGPVAKRWNHLGMVGAICRFDHCLYQSVAASCWWRSAFGSARKETSQCPVFPRRRVPGQGTANKQLKYDQRRQRETRPEARRLSDQKHFGLYLEKISTIPSKPPLEIVFSWTMFKAGSSLACLGL